MRNNEIRLLVDREGEASNNFLYDSLDPKAFMDHIWINSHSLTKLIINTLFVLFHLVTDLM